MSMYSVNSSIQYDDRIAPFKSNNKANTTSLASTIGFGSAVMKNKAILVNQTIKCAALIEESEMSPFIKSKCPPMSNTLQTVT